ncbi:IPT/TIG domain-containing protein [Psychroserpens damuponensis]|uniref:IPT/TIG domain-containing protein n=1 Tax=Psychroserpens damuponensis TaxID=943936 RepID=UPI000694D559|nr:IPT/TIG domain-containing protein [Psychroserpens damuponensis]
MKTLFKLMMLACIVIFTACSSNDEAPVPENKNPNIASISPTEGPMLSTVVISGENFGTDVSKVEVYFDDIESVVQSLTDSEIVVTVPSKAYNGELKLVINNEELQGPTFNYIISDVEVTTIAGGSQGYLDAIGTNAEFNELSDGVIDSQGNLFVVDKNNHVIRKMTPDGNVDTFAGAGGSGYSDDPNGGEALFDTPYSIAIDAQDNLYVCDNFKVRKITPLGAVTTLAGSTEGFQNGTGSEAKFKRLTGISIDAIGNVYVADPHNSKIRKITQEGVVTTFAGTTEGDVDGDISVAQFNKPTDMCFDSNGNLFVTDEGNDKIKKITPNGIVSTYAGNAGEGFLDGSLEAAKFNHPYDIEISVDDTIFIQDYLNNSIRKITPNGQITTIAGAIETGNQDGDSNSARFFNPWGITLGPDYTIYVFDTNNNSIRKVVER